MTRWFTQLELRERRFLLAGSLVLSVIVGYFWLFEPFLVAKAELNNMITAQQTTLRWMQETAQDIQQLRRQTTASSSKNPTQSLLSLIDSSMNQGNLGKATKRIEPKGEQEVRVNFEQVSFTELMRWLGQLHNQYAIEVSNISLERERMPDVVKVRLTLYNSLN